MTTAALSHSWAKPLQQLAPPTVRVRHPVSALNVVPGAYYIYTGSTLKVALGTVTVWIVHDHKHDFLQAFPT